MKGVRVGYQGEYGLDFTFGFSNCAFGLGDWCNGIYQLLSPTHTLCALAVAEMMWRLKI
jgi:hypothetical protein